MTRPLVFATRNRGKLVELRELLPGHRRCCRSTRPRALGRAIPEVVEDADTFVGNAAKKAREVSARDRPARARRRQRPRGRRARRRARRATARATPARGHDDDAANNAKLLAALAGVPPSGAPRGFAPRSRSPTSRGPLGDRVITADGACEGVILDAPRGTGGFGYDPLFFAPELGQTFAEAGVGSKSQLSHRARAMRAIEPQLLAYLRSC